ncbi:MAG: adenylyltransferase/cytidyltransferase family protein [Candidatus Pacebacteria bacterium]|nr:adenylyltransferase/cytidyltransferase family protein [Candidatus Paceibacterota bacterium]MDR3583377.1 adenylyltransferase/cytidyltransferase family protein [Candidatus Paceibacterota bacterium]
MDVKLSSFLGSGRLISTEDINKITTALKNNGYKIVLTQGVWDLIHEGHAKYLQKAKGFGDILIVAVDTDEVVRHRKGPNRPIVPEKERVKMISHLKYVDLIVMKESKTDHNKLIRTIKPDVLVISDSTPSNKEGKSFFDEVKEEHEKFCGKIINLKPQSTTSTTARIRLLTIKGAEDLAKELQKSIENFLYNNKI